jgi:predicted nucleic acid-binding protein
MPSTVSIEPPRLFIDSAGFIALHVPNDEHHEAAVACRDQTLRFSRLYTTAAVVSETVAHIQRDNLLNDQSLQDVIDDFLTPGKWSTSFLPVDDEVLMKSLRMVRERRSPRFSVVDATNLVLMEKHQIDIIFSYDSLYDGETVMRGFQPRFIQRVGP